MGLDTLDETKPADTDFVSQGDDEIRLTRAATKQSFGVEHNLAGPHRFLVGTAAQRPAAGNLGRLYINTSNNTIEFDNGSGWVATGAVVVPGSVDGNALAANSVDSSKIVDGSIQAIDIKPGTITGDRLAPTTITPDKIVSGSLGPAQIAPLSLTKAVIGIGQTVQGWQGTGLVAPVTLPTLNLETGIMTCTWASRGSFWLCISSFSGTIGFSSSTYNSIHGRIRLDTGAGTVLASHVIDQMATATGVTEAPFTLTMAAMGSGLSSGNHAMIITATSEGTQIGNPRISAGWTIVIEPA